MTKFHASVRDLLEDVHRFLVDSLQTETISGIALTHKEKLLTRLKALEKEYPELHLNFGNTNEMRPASNCPPSSPIPYVDMNGGSPYKIPFFPSNVEKDSYDVCNPKDNYDSIGSQSVQSVTESEDYTSDEAKNIPEVAASDLYACEKSGYLDKKKRESIKGWLNPYQKRWCAIKDGVLYYYEKTTDRKQKGCIILSGYEARALQEDNKDGKKYNYLFELVCPGKRTYQFSAPSEKDLHQWIAAVEHNSRSLSPVMGKILKVKITNERKSTKKRETVNDLQDLNKLPVQEQVKKDDKINKPKNKNRADITSGNQNIVKKKSEKYMRQKKLAAERQQRRRAKMTAEELAIKRQKDRERYVKKKEKKIVLPISERSSRDQRLQRKEWRKNSKNYRTRNSFAKYATNSPSLESDNVMSLESDNVKFTNMLAFVEGTLMKKETCR